MPELSKTARRKILLKAHLEGTQDALRQLCELDGFNYDDEIERDFCVACVEYEKKLFDQHGRHVPAGRTRKQIAAKGVVACIERQVLSPHRQTGLTLLIDDGKPEWTSEHIVLKYPSRFSAQVVTAAKRALGSK